MSNKEMEKTNKRLFKLCMQGKWEKVVEMYKNKKQAHTAKITRTGDTALHVAITDGQDEVVQQLVTLICSVDKEALGIKNERKNTALHFAASMGSVKMCECIASADASLLSVRNVDGETPLFLAALHGRKQAFLCLHYFHIRVANNYYSNCRRNDGDTILHSAIAGDYFDLAFQIIHLYEDLVNWVNECGFSPLHLLASKTSAFRSSSRLGRLETIVYHGILVNELEVEPKYQLHPPTKKGKCGYPENYETCINLWWVMKNSASVVTNKFPVTRFLINKFIEIDRTLNRPDLEASQQTATNGTKTKSSGSGRSPPLFPDNYKSCADFFKFVFMTMLVIFGRGSSRIQKIRRKKEKHVWSAQIMNELLRRASTYEYDDNGNNPLQYLKDKSLETAPYSFDKSGDVTFASVSVMEEQQSSTITGLTQHKKVDGKVNQETPLLIAAKNGVTEMVEKILELFPVAIHDMDAKKKNIVLLAIENRQPHLYELLLKRKILKESLFRKVDNEGNSALHLAAKLGEYKPWLIPGAALQMQWEIKWYFFVKESMPPHFFGRYNKDYKTPREIFSETHREMVKSGGEWLNKTSESCSLVAALIATVAFATSTTVPGGVHESTGIPTLEDRPAFNVFAISSLIALCCSVTSLALFLSILTSRYQEQDFGKDLPRKLIFGLTSLFMSITSMLLSFCAGHFFMLKEKLKNAALPVYAVICLPVTLFALAQFPLYFDLIRATFKKIPHRSYKATLL
ncbi:uncharacterized protein LOC109787847 [Cajanus cajan]|uniref:uncharacterized protein LOC109787847 n=1 Tax=Cajanus cajan TaxID=3821 RepID=UPI0010FAE590|nr:uncharacterized protein LOC109787847 [Cajanus cajan]